MDRLLTKFFLSVLVPVAFAASVVLFVSCSNHPDVQDFKQIQLHWNAVDDVAEQSKVKDYCVIDITSKVMHDPVVLASKLVEISYEVSFSALENDSLAFEGRCSDERFADLKECSWQTTCGVGSSSVVKFHNER